MEIINIETSPETEKLDAALAAAQKEIHFAAKDASNPFFNSSYATLKSVWDAVREPLTKNGISVTQWPIHSTDGWQHLVTHIACQGQWIRAHASMPVAKKDPQGYGSAITYLKRYALAAVVGVPSDEDDDGNSANGNVFQTEKQNTEPMPKKIAPTNHAPQFQDPGKFVCSIGRKYKGKKVEDIDKTELAQYIEWLEGQAEQTNNPLQGAAFEFVKHAKDFLSKF